MLLKGIVFVLICFVGIGVLMEGVLHITQYHIYAIVFSAIGIIYGFWLSEEVS